MNDTTDSSTRQETMDVDVNEQNSNNSSSFVTFDCPEPQCIMQFRREDRLRAHLLVGSHKYVDMSLPLLDKAALMYKNSLESDRPKQVPVLSVISTTRTTMTPRNNLEQGWTLFHPRKKVPFTPVQRTYLNQKYDDGEASGAKWDPVSVAQVSLFYSLRDSTSNSCLISM